MNIAIIHHRYGENVLVANTLTHLKLRVYDEYVKDWEDPSKIRRNRSKIGRVHDYFTDNLDGETIDYYEDPDIGVYWRLGKAPTEGGTL